MTTAPDETDEFSTVFRNGTPPRFVRNAHGLVVDSASHPGKFVRYICGVNDPSPSLYLHFAIINYSTSFSSVGLFLASPRTHM